MNKTSRAIIVLDNKLLVFFRKKIIDNQVFTYYAIPGGHVEVGETLEETVIRELKEEMNIDIEVLCYLGKIEIDNKEEYYFHCKMVGGQLKFGGEELDRCNDSDYYEIRWIGVDEILNSDIRAIEFVKSVMNI